MRKIGYLENEVLLFLLLKQGGRANLREISLCTGDASRRSVSRYLKDLKDCGAITEPLFDRCQQQYLVGIGSWDTEFPGTGRRDIHLRRLARITWLLNSEEMEDERLTGKDLVSIYECSDAPCFWAEFPSLRSVQRDLATAKKIMNIWKERNRL